MERSTVKLSAADLGYSNLWGQRESQPRVGHLTMGDESMANSGYSTFEG